MRRRMIAYEFDRDRLQEIDRSVNLYEYASKQLPFQWRGHNWWTNCPSGTHQDDNASLAIDPQQNMFKCFACGAGGGIINWLRFYEGLGFKEAVEKAERLAGLGDSPRCVSQTMLFNKSLAPRPQKIVARQPLNPAEYNRYEQELPQEWLDEGISPAAMNRYYVRIDTEKNRIVYPVFDSAGHFINIKGRTRYKSFKELKIPKYINYFKVWKLDYFQGWGQAQDSIKEKGEVIIFEGIKSCMKAFDYGYLNTVSAETHEINDDQVALLIKLGQNVVIAFDSDVNPWKVKGLDKLKRFLNVYLIDGRGKLGEKASPVDQGKELWESLYQQRIKI